MHVKITSEPGEYLKKTTPNQADKKPGNTPSQAGKKPGNIVRRNYKQ